MNRRRAFKPSKNTLTNVYGMPINADKAHLMANSSDFTIDISIANEKLQMGKAANRWVQQPQTIKNTNCSAKLD